MATIPRASRISPDDCTCVEPGCGFLAPPRALLDHLVAEHSMRAVRITYGEQYQIVVPESESELLLLAEEDEGVFLLALAVDESVRGMVFKGNTYTLASGKVNEEGGCSALRKVGVHCLRARAAVGPAYIWMVSAGADGLASMRKAGPVSRRDGPALVAPSCSLRATLHGESKAVHLRITIRTAPSWKRRVLTKFGCF